MTVVKSFKTPDEIKTVKQYLVLHPKLKYPLAYLYKENFAILRLREKPPEDVIPQEAIITTPENNMFVRAVVYNPLKLKPLAFGTLLISSLKRDKHNNYYFSGVLRPTDYKYFKIFCKNLPLRDSTPFPCYYHDNTVINNYNKPHFYICRINEKQPNIIFPLISSTNNYTPEKVLSELATIVPNHIYEDIVKTLDLKIEDDKITFFAYHTDSDDIVKHIITFDKEPFRVNVCTDISRFSSPAEFILSSYIQHKNHFK